MTLAIKNLRFFINIASLFLFGGLMAYWIGIGYMRSDAMFFAGLGVLGLSLVLREPGRGSWRFGLLALLCVGLAFAVPARTFHFLALVFSAFFVLENYWGKINEAPLFVALLLTAGAKTMSMVMGFPMRLQLSENAATALRALGSDASAEGNLIHFKGGDFLVDSACAGLQMVEVSFLFAFLLLGLFERGAGRHLRWPLLLGVIGVTGVLILIFNQLRIIFLVVFDIPPENPMHDVVGLFGLMLYVFVPLWWGIRWAFGKFGVLESMQGGNGTRIERIKRICTDFLNQICVNPFNLFNPWPILVIKSGVHILLLGFLGYFALGVPNESYRQNETEKVLIPAGLPTNCKKEQLKGGIAKYSNDSLLIYVKPIRGWYDTEHTPLICWQGSGYEFAQMQERIFDSTTVYTGVLEKKGSLKYYTAWWFDNGKERTISQVKWRWLDAGGASGFSLVNVTASDWSTLDKQLKLMLKN